MSYSYAGITRIRFAGQWRFWRRTDATYGHSLSRAYPSSLSLILLIDTIITDNRRDSTAKGVMHIVICWAESPTASAFFWNARKCVALDFGKIRYFTILCMFIIICLEKNIQR